jgi:glycosyltransferase involved in cell wall biosynthesis
MFPSLLYAVRRLRKGFEPDIIDAHFAYPAGVAAVWLGRILKKPVVITGRGEDIVKFPKLPIVGRFIRHALRRATHLIGVSQEIAQIMERLAGNTTKVAVIPNGVDTQAFRPLDQQKARQRLAIPQDVRLILSVGYRLELKGFHLLIDALPEIRRYYPNAIVAIVGGQASWAPDFLPVLKRHIARHSLHNAVLLPGEVPQCELIWWYNAANVFALLSSREGSPNALMESLACGTPAVVTPVGGMPETVNSKELGVVLPERSAEAAAQGIIRLLGRPPDRQRIRQIMENRDWQKTAETVDRLFRNILANGRL